MDPIRQKVENKEISPIPDANQASGLETQAPGIRIEKEPLPEIRPEQEGLRETAKSEVHEQPLASQQPSTSSQVSTVPPSVTAEQIKAVETILEENLQAVFNTLDPEQQKEFKRQGEVAARTIAGLMSAVKFKVKEITRAIIQWLRFIPGVSNFFVEQEAKIKTDKLIELHLRQTNQR